MLIDDVEGRRRWRQRLIFKACASYLTLKKAMSINKLYKMMKY